MNKIIEPLKQHLKARDCVYDYDRKRGIIHFGLEAANARWRCMGCRTEAGGLALVSLIPLMVPESRRGACAELLVRINWRIAIGHFDMDFRDGDLRFLTTVPLGEEDELSDAVVEHLVFGHQALVSTFIPGIAAVIFTGLPPEKAVEMDGKCESAQPRFSLN